VLQDRPSRSSTACSAAVKISVSFVSRSSVHVTQRARWPSGPATGASYIIWSSYSFHYANPSAFCFGLSSATRSAVPRTSAAHFWVTYVLTCAATCAPCVRRLERQMRCEMGDHEHGPCVRCATVTNIVNMAATTLWSPASVQAACCSWIFCVSRLNVFRHLVSTLLLIQTIRTTGCCIAVEHSLTCWLVHISSYYAETERHKIKLKLEIPCVWGTFSTKEMEKCPWIWSPARAKCQSGRKSQSRITSLWYFIDDEYFAQILLFDTLTTVSLCCT